MRSIGQPVHQHQHAPATAPMMLVRTPDGGMGWVPASVLGQPPAMGQPSPQQQMAMAQMQAQQQQALVPMQQAMPMPMMQPPPAAPSTLKTILLLGGVGLAGWWAWKKWGHNLIGGMGGGGSHDEDEGGGMSERKNYVRSRRRRRSRSRMLSEFKSFLDNDGGGARELEEVGCRECAADGDDGAYEREDY